MEDALGPIGAGMIGLSLYVILKAIWWGGGYDEPTTPVVRLEEEPLRRSTRTAFKRRRSD